MLSLKTFGGLSVAADGAPGTGAARQPKTLALLALLAAARPHGMSREKLVALLWPESDTPQARGLLKQACYALRRDLHAPDLFLGTTELQLNPAVMTSDVEAFAAALERGDREAALAVYDGSFLDGFYLRGGAEFERWVEAERTRLTRAVWDAVEGLAQEASARGDTRAAVQWWRRLVTLDPISAPAALGLMHALAVAGESESAVRVGLQYQASVRRELEMEPAADVVALTDELRHRPAVAPVRVRDAAALLGPGAEVRGGGVRWRRPMVSVAATVLALGGLAVALALANHRTAPTDRFLLAVIPFNATDELRPTSQLVANQLSSNLDGAGPYRAVPPALVARQWSGRADRQSATAIAGRTGARLVLVGDLVRAEPDSVRLKATLVDPAGDRLIQEFNRSGVVTRVSDAVDSLSLDAMMAVAATLGVAQLPVGGTRSLAALKAFLRGEYHWRRFALDSAIIEFDRATALDSTFAMAVRGAGRARDWLLQSGESYRVRAGMLNHGLDVRDSLLIAADSQGVGRFHWGFVARKRWLLQEASARFPDDPDVWFTLGMARLGDDGEGSWESARRAFDRAIAVDSSFAPPYVAAVRIALRDDDRAAALAYVRGYQALPHTDGNGAGMSLLGTLLDSRSGGRRVFERALETATPASLAQLALTTQEWPDEAETQVVAARRLFGLARMGAAGVPADRRLATVLLSEALVYRGHLREARTVVGSDPAVPAFMELARLGAISVDSVASTLVAWIRRPGGDDLCEQTMDAAIWWAARKDTANLKYLVHREDSLVRVAERVPWVRPVPGFARAALALARGDTSGALRGFVFLGRDQSEWWSSADSLCPSGARPRREIQFRLLVAAERYADALWVFDHMHYRRVPQLFERARLAERQGDRLTALKYYQIVAQAWARADPELQPVVDDARAGIRRIVGQQRR